RDWSSDVCSSDLAWRHDKNGLGEVFVALGVGECIQHLPGDDHGHHCGLAAAGGHLVAQALPGAAIPRNGDALLEFRGCLYMPDKRFDRLQLAEVETVLAAAVRVLPVLQKLPGNGGNAGVVD